MELPEAHARAVAHTQLIFDAIRPEQLGDPTPCDDWDVATLAHHVIYGNYWVPPLVAGETIDEVGDRFEGDIVGGDISGAFRASGALAVEAFNAPGAMEAPCPVSYGPVPGSVYCGHRLIDVLIHGWDMAVAIGYDTVLPADLVDACLAVAEPQAEGFAASGAFGHAPDLPEGAGPQTRLLAILGRTG